MHLSRPAVISVDVPADRHDESTAFWSGAFGRSSRLGTVHPEYAVLGDVAGWGVLVQSTGNADSRVHFDIHTDNLDAEVARLVQLGATVHSSDNEWTVMSDPSGVLFCVCPCDTDDPSLLGATEWD
jgi:predicted enzyme related to lactoylglutathione lyase